MILFYFCIFNYVKMIKIHVFYKKVKFITLNEYIKSLEGLLLSNYIKNHEKNIHEILFCIQKLDKKRYERNKRIIDFWHYLDNNLVVYENTAPDDLPTKNHAFVVLGNQLNDNGTLSDEGIGRCDVAYKSAIKYPNSMIYVTGGGTSKYNKSVTEGEQMYQYLVNVKKLNPKRIIKEIRAMNTIENTKNTFQILKKDNIKSITIITSEYHVKRATLLFYVESLLNDYPISIIKNVGYHSGKTERKYLEISNLALLLKVQFKDEKNIQNDKFFLYKIKKTK